MALKTYVIHATCRYVVKSKADGRCENGQNRPTIAVEASSEQAAIRKATREQKKRVSSDHWPVVSFALIPELVNVIEHPTPAQRGCLRELRDRGRTGADQGMKRRLLDKGWIEPEGNGYALTPRGRTEAAV